MMVPGIGVKVTVEGEVGVYKSRIVDYNFDEIMLEYPINISNGKTGLFYRGERIEVSFVGKDGAMYKYRPKLKRKKRDNIPLLVFEAPTRQNVKRIQRREYVRVSDTKSVSLLFGDKVFSGILLDISAGGVAIKIKESQGIHVGDKVFCEILLTTKLMGLNCEVKRVSKTGPYYKFSLQFINIEESKRRILTRYVFSKQVELRKKGVM